MKAVEHKERIPGTRSVAQRIVNAEKSFIQLVMEKGFSRAEATKIMQTYLKLKVAKLDPVGGVIRVQHGAFWELEPLRNALKYQPPARRRRNPQNKKISRRRAPRGKTVTTVSQSKVIRRTTNRRPLHVLYATKPRHARLKYLGHGKFGARGRPVMFPTAAEANAVGRALVDAFPQILRGWTVRADKDTAPAAPVRRFQAEPMGPAEAMYREQVRRDTEAAHRWLARQKK